MCIPHFQLYSGVQAYMVSLDQAEGEQGSKGFPWRKWLGLECGGGGVGQECWACQHSE